MARDVFHGVVREALEKDGWTITHNTYPLHNRKEGGLSTDLGAEKVIIAERGPTKIAVEVKRFIHIVHPA